MVALTIFYTFKKQIPNPKFMIAGNLYLKKSGEEYLSTLLS
jgi:hypothetical protein